MTPYKFLVGVLLTIAMIVVLVSASVLFAVRDFQYGLAKSAPATAGLLDDAKLEGAEGVIVVLQRDASVRQLVLQIADIESRARLASAGSVAADTSATALRARLQTLAAQQNLSPQDQHAITEMDQQVDQLAAVEAQIAAAPQETAGQLEQRVAVQRLAASGPEAQQALLAQYRGYERARSELNALAALSPAGIATFLAHGHPAQLSIVLVMLMGALGALLYLFPAYLTRPVPVTMAEIAVRLIFGACAALAFYVIANATVAGFSLSDAVGAAESSATLNPFTVSLIGIVAGVLAEDIAKWIQERGRGVFQQGGGAAAQVTSEGVNPHGGPNTP